MKKSTESAYVAQQKEHSLEPENLRKGKKTNVRDQLRPEERRPRSKTGTSVDGGSGNTCSWEFFGALPAKAFSSNDNMAIPASPWDMVSAAAAIWDSAGKDAAGVKMGRADATAAGSGVSAG